MMIIRGLLFVTVFATSLLAGYKAGEEVDPINQILENYFDVQTVPGVKIPNNNQFNLLIIGIDDIDRSDAHLESIWLVAQAENSSKISLVPIFPSFDDPVKNKIIFESFNLNKGKPGKEFWDAMRDTNFWWNGYLISDINTSIEVIDILGGIEINNIKMNGLQAVGSITSWKDDPSIAIYHQKLFLESLCDQIAVNQSSNLKDISELLDQSFYSNIRTNFLIAGWATRAAFSEKLTCTFPTLTQISFQAKTVNP